MRKSWGIPLGVLGLVLAVFGSARAADENCNAFNPAIVPTNTPAAVVENGWNCPLTDLIINADLTPTLETLIIRSKSIAIFPVLPATVVNIVNPIAGSDLRLQAVNGNIDIDNANIRARDIMKIECQAPANCMVEADNSTIVASSTLNAGPPNFGGDLRFVALGLLRLENSTIWGGGKIGLTSVNGSIIWYCPGSGAAGCQDPLTSGVLQSLCGDPPVFPCNVSFPNAAALHAVCFPAGDAVICGGGNSEANITAFVDIDIRGSTLVFFEHATFEAKTGSILAGPRDGNKANISGIDLGFTSKLAQDFTEATLTASNNLTIKASACVNSPPDVCINAFKSIMDAKDIKITGNNNAAIINLCAADIDDVGNDFPVLNGGNAPDNPGPGNYPATVRYTTAQCAPDAGAIIDGVQQ